jgi:hypothetical protein
VGRRRRKAQRRMARRHVSTADRKRKLFAFIVLRFFVQALLTMHGEEEGIVVPIRAPRMARE